MPRVALPILCVLAIASLAMALAQPLEGTRWRIKLVPDEDARRAGEKETEDVLSFKGGQFSSETWAKKGFKPVEFEEDTRGLTTALFKAEAKSDTDGTAKWSGSVTSIAMKGEFVWTRKDGTELNYTLTGEKVQN
jgi:hypothetical protein